METAFWKPHRLRLFITVTSGLLFLIVFIVTAWGLYEARKVDQRQAAQASGNLTLSLEREIARNLELYDLSLQAAAKGLALRDFGSLAPDVQQSVLFDGAVQAEHFGGILITDRDGEVMFSSVPNAVHRLNLSGRDYFRAQQQTADLGLFMGKPFVSRVSGLWSIGFSRRLNDPDGTFTGVVAGAMRLDLFQALFSLHEVGPGGSVSLYSTDGTLLTRRPYDERDIGRNLSDSELFRRLPGASSGTFETNSRVDGIRRLFTYRQVGVLPLVVSVAVTTKTVYANWVKKTWVVSSILLALSVVAGLLGFALRHELRSREQAEKLLRHSEAKFRLLMEHASDVVSRVGPDGARQYVSPASTRVLGLTPAEIFRSSLPELIHPDDRHTVELSAQRLLAGTVEADTVIFRLGRGDTELFIEATARSLQDAASGKPDGYIAIWRDVTERMRIEAERDAHAIGLETANALLERMVRHLNLARDRADQASQAKSRFLASMSHELRTPLNGILGYAQLLQLEGGLNGAQKRRVDGMLEAGRHLLGMINRVLDLSEIEADRLELRVADLDPDEVAGTCLDLVRPTAEAKGITLRLVTAPDMPPHVLGDATRLRQVLLNLLGNAVKFTLQGSVELRLQPLGKGGLRVEVADTGPGIPAEKRQQLFQDFERLGADTGATEGAGLGLAISARLMRLMGGRIGYEDNPGGGSLFWLELPEADVSGSVPAIPSHVQQSTPLPAHPLRILVVDDVAMNRDVAQSFLRAAGHDVVCAEGGAEAARVAATQDFDAILMDVRMPGVDGLEATRRIRAIESKRGGTPIVALTAQAFVEQVAECRKVGMDGHLAKPFTQEALLDAVGRAIVIGTSRVAAACAMLDLDCTSTAAPIEAAPELESDLPIFDRVAFERTAVFLPPDAVAEYLQTLAARADSLLAQLREPEALAKNALDLAEAAHSLAGSAGMFGFERVSAVARLFERAVETASPGTQALADRLTLVLDASLEALRHHAITTDQAEA